MIIRCEYCNNKYSLDESKVNTPGIWFGCTNCGEVFYVDQGLNRGKSEAELKDDERVDLSDTQGGEIDSALDKDSFPFVENNSLNIQGKEINETKLRHDDANVGLRVDADTEIQIDANSKSDYPKPFNWQELRVDTETEDRQYDYPKLFEDSDEASLEGNSEKLETGIDHGLNAPVRRPYSGRLEVDREKILKTNIEESVTSYYRPEREIYRRKKFGGSFLKTAFNYIMVLLFTLIMIVAVITILMSLELISNEKITAYGNYLRSKFAFTLPNISSSNVVITGSVGRWVSTRDGLLYLVSGQITNNSNKVVNFVKIKSEFKSAGENVFEQTVYAGNTLSENELKTLPIEDTILKLKRKSGDIDFNDPRKLAGLNYGIKPGESIPFYIVFPSKKRILGLKYDIEVLEFETASKD